MPAPQDAKSQIKFVPLKNKLSYVKVYAFSASRRSFMSWALGLGAGFFFLQHRVLQAAGYYNLAALWRNPANGEKGYFGGGSTGSSSNEIDGINLSSAAAVNPAATLSVARSAPAGVNSATTGYFGGGTTGTVTSDIDGITFGTQAATNPAATLAVARSGAGSASSSTTGYFFGGSI